MTFLFAEESPKIYYRLKEIGIEAIAGNASDAEIWETTNPEFAQHIAIAMPKAFEAGRIKSLARSANPVIRIIMRVCLAAEAQPQASRMLA